MKHTVKAEILKKLSVTEKKARQENQGTNIVLDRRNTEKLFSREKNNLTKEQFHGSIMRSVRDLHYSGYLTKLNRGMYMFTNYGRRMADLIN